MTGHRSVEPPKSNKPVSDYLGTLFGKNLREIRIKAGLTQALVAERTGLAQQYVALVEAGHQDITLGTMIALTSVCQPGREDAAPKRTRPRQAAIVYAVSGTA